MLLEDVSEGSKSVQILEDLPTPPKLIVISLEKDVEPEEDQVEEQEMEQEVGAATPRAAY